MPESKMCVLFVILALLLFFAPKGSALAASDEYVEGEAIVLLKNNAKTALTEAGLASDEMQEYVNEEAGKADAAAVYIYVTLSVETDEIFVLMKSDTLTTDELIERLNMNPNVISASPNEILRLDPVHDDTGQSSVLSTMEEECN